MKITDLPSTSTIAASDNVIISNASDGTRRITRAGMINQYSIPLIGLDAILNMQINLLKHALGSYLLEVRLNNGEKTPGIKAGETLVVGTTVDILTPILTVGTTSIAFVPGSSTAYPVRISHATNTGQIAIVNIGSEDIRANWWGVSNTLIGYWR